MDIFEFTGKLFFEDVPKFLFEKLPEGIEETLENASDSIDKFLDD